jgi:predicted permease
MIQRWREWRERRAEYSAAVEEMKFHIEQETEHNISRGMTPRAARRAALKAFGGVDRFAEEARDERTGTKLSDFAMSYLDWKLGGRMLLKYPALSVIGGLTLASAIGLGAGWFEMTMLTLYPDLPLPDGDRIVRVENWDAAASATEPRSLHDFLAWREQLTSIEQLGAYRTLERNLITTDGMSQPVQVAEISASTFPLTRVPPMLGRPLTEDDAQPGGANVVVIGYDIWQSRFGGERDVIGREVQLGRASATIVGVMPDGFGFPRNHQVWMPLRVRQVPLPREGSEIAMFGRLADGVTLESAQAELAAAGARMAAANPATHAQLRPRVLTFAAPSGPGARRELLLLNLAAWLMLGAACANVATLMFARTAMRESEIVVRNALGASRMRVMGQLFTEALVLTTAAAIVGLGAARLVIGYVFDMNAVQTQLPFWWDAGIEPVTVLYTALLAVVGAALVALLPAIRATRDHVQAGLARMSAGGTSMHFGGVWSVIIVLQVAFSVICLPLGMAAVSEAIRDHELRAAFPADAFLTFRAELDTDATPAAASDPGDTELRARSTDVIADLSRRLKNEPAVAGVAVTAALPGTYHRLRTVEVQRGAEPPFIVDTNTEGSRVRIAAVGVEFFAAFRVPIIAGRTFRATDVGAQNGVVVINEAMALNIGGNPVGARVRFAAAADDEPGPWNEVIGVVENLGLTPTGRGEADFMFQPVSAADAAFVGVRVNGDAVSFAPRLRTIATQADPGLRLYDVMSLREVIRREDLPIIQSILIGIGVVLLAIILSAASLYALMSVAVARRTREIGIRVAIGATPREVLSALFKRAAAQVGVGIVIGNALFVLLLSIVVDELQPGFILRLILLMITASAVMTLVGLAACLVPGRRALRVQPTVALKEAR